MHGTREEMTEKGWSHTVETRHGLQKECPHGVVTGSQSSCRQMEHSSMDIVIFPIVSSKPSPAGRAASSETGPLSTWSSEFMLHCAPSNCTLTTGDALCLLSNNGNEGLKLVSCKVERPAARCILPASPTEEVCSLPAQGQVVGHSQSRRVGTFKELEQAATAGCGASHFPLGDLCERLQGLDGDLQFKGCGWCSTP